MSAQAVLAQLEAAGSAQTRKTYARHGITGRVWGVSYAVLGQLTRRIKRDHPLATELWASGWHDARVLATMIADPQQADAKLLNAWAADCNNCAVAGALAKLAAASPEAEVMAEKWCASRHEMEAVAGWDTVAELALKSTLPDAKFGAWLKLIERDIHQSPNFVRQAMNNALIAIGCRNEKLEKLAVAAAKRIGPVEVDHGDTSCQTPDAVTYIMKTWARRAKKAGNK